MPNWADIERKLSYGRGKEAAVLGPPFNIFRVGSSAAGNYLDSEQQIQTNVAVAYETAPANLRRMLEAEKIPGVILYKITCDNVGLGLLIGDCGINADPQFRVGFDQVTFSTLDINGFCLIQASPGKDAIGVRINKIAKVYRQSLTPGSNGAWAPGLDNAAPLVLNAGSFSIGAANATPTNLPIGLFPVPRPYGDKSVADAPGTYRKSGWSGYAPPLKGFHFKEGDRVVLADGASYVVIFPAYQETGATGTYLFLERESPQTVA